jgi:YidC/Oxa1 family membrane protein insertase
MNPQNNKNLILATSLSVIIMISWTWFYEKPRLEKISLQHQIEQSNQGSKDEKISDKIVEENSNPAIPNVEKLTTEVAKNVNPEEKNDISTSFKTRKEIIEKTIDERIKIETKSLHGSINLKGAKFDDLTLAKYFKNPDKKDEVILFSPVESKERYFADFGFASSDSNLETPKPDTIWQANNKKLTPRNPVTLSWTNSKNIEFQMKISIDENYLFTIQQKIINNSFENIAVAPFARINRLLNDQQKATYILHEGAIGAFNGILSEKTYEDLIKEKSQKFSDKGESGSWLGITDKYWLSSIIPDRKIAFEGNFFHDYKNKNNF